MTDREAMQMALEALERVALHLMRPQDVEVMQALRAQLEQPEQVSHAHEWFRTGAMEPGKMRCIHCGAWGNDASLTTSPQQQAEPVAAESITDAMMNLVDRLGSESKKVDLRAWPHLLVYAPQQQTEPVALIRDGVLRWHIPHEHYSRPAWTAHGTHMLYTHPPQRKRLSDFDARGILAAKLTCWHRLNYLEADELVKLFIDHVAPPQRKPLTDAEIEATFLTCNGKWDGDQWVIEDADFHPFARAIEQANGIGEKP